LSADENVRRLEQIHSTEAAAAAAAAKASTHQPIISAASPGDDDDDAYLKTNAGVAGVSGQSGVASWSRDDVTRWLTDNSLFCLNNW